jgi:hypothetical protein
MERYIHDQNLAHYRRLVAESEREEAEHVRPQDRRH